MFCAYVLLVERRGDARGGSSSRRGDNAATLHGSVVGSDGRRQGMAAEQPTATAMDVGEPGTGHVESSSGGGDGGGWGAATTGGAAMSGATPMEVDEVGKESDGRGSGGRGSDGAGGSGDQLAARVAEIDIDAVTERVTSEQSAARPALFGGEAAGVKKNKKKNRRNKHGGRTGDERRRG